MAKSMNVLFAAAEMAPLVKVGGLADVAGALPKALRAAGLDVRVALPLYATIDRTAATRIAALPGDAALWRTDVGRVPVYLVEQEGAFGRERIYEHPDDTERYLAFCDGLLEATAVLDWRPDVLHLNDWHPGLLATRLAAAEEHPWSGAARVATVHNLGFPGEFDAAFAKRHKLRTGGAAIERSSLAQSIIHADRISTVSPTYAREILTPKFGGRLAKLLRARRARLSGILNGIDVDLFDPVSDPHLIAAFDSETPERRALNKAAIQRRLGLAVQPRAPLIGMVSRLFRQKGIDLAAEAVSRLLRERNLQFVVLGRGDEANERLLRDLANRHPGNVAVEIDFDLALGQLIYGGCDIFLMPSRYEPCGLGQFIAMRYGAVPVVRRTGGLADSVRPYRPGGPLGTGFLFEEATPKALVAALQRAIATYERKAGWRRLQQRGMRQDFSWSKPAAQYAELYREAVRLKGSGQPGAASP